MKVVLADTDGRGLVRAAAELRARGAAALAVRTDVRRAADVEDLARRALRAFRAVHIVCNNAGLASPSATSWEKRLADWRLVLDVNLWGVIHGIRTFVPILLEQRTEGHVVNTASAAAFLHVPDGADYVASKQAVVGISESLYLELARARAKVGVSVLCPGWVRTGILDAMVRRSRGVRLRPGLAAAQEELRRQLEKATPPAEIAAQVVAAVRARRLYVLPHPVLGPPYGRA
jgi:NAD(P)-dependent dehydrogenase (short-subunit alcohol dehydrogenase family)